MHKDQILFAIINYKQKDNAERLYRMISPYFMCHLLDAYSGELPDSFNGDTIYLNNVFYRGMLNKAIELATEGNFEYLFFICSDVVIDEPDISKLCYILSEEKFSNVAIYSPSHKSSSYTFVHWGYMLSNKGKRRVPYVEGMISMWHKDIYNKMYPLLDNQYGWGIDVVAAYYAKILHKRIVVDDRVQIFHPKGPTEKNDAAGECALNYINQLPEAEQIRQYWHWIYVFRKNKSANILLMKNYQKWCMLCYKMCKHLPFLKFYKFEL